MTQPKPDTHVIDTDGVRRRRLTARLLRWNRRVHMYLGLFMLPWVLVYGCSALFFNHADLLPAHEVRRLSLDGSTGAFAQLPEPAVYAQRVVDAVREHSLAESMEGEIALIDPEAARFVGTTHVTVETETHRHELYADVADGDVLLRTVDRASGGESPPALRQLSSIEIDDPLRPWIETGVLDWLETQGVWADRATYRNGPRVEFRMLAGGEPWRVTFDIGTGNFTALPIERRPGSVSTRNFLTRLHTTHGFPNEMRAHSFWALAVDLMGSGLIIWATSGIIMWWQMPKVRLWGGVTLAVSLLLAGGLGYAMYSVFTN